MIPTGHIWNQHDPAFLEDLALGVSLLLPERPEDVGQARRAADRAVRLPIEVVPEGCRNRQTPGAVQKRLGAGHRSPNGLGGHLGLIDIGCSRADQAKGDHECDGNLALHGQALHPADPERLYAIARVSRYLKEVLNGT